MRRRTRRRSLQAQHFTRVERCQYRVLPVEDIQSYLMPAVSIRRTNKVIDGRAIPMILRRMETTHWRQARPFHRLVVSPTVRWRLQILERRLARLLCRSTTLALRGTSCMIDSWFYDTNECPDRRAFTILAYMGNTLVLRPQQHRST